MLIWRRSEVLLGMIKWDVGWRSDGNPEAGSARFFRWNNIEKASSPSESKQRDREGTVDVSACCHLSVPTATARRLPDN